MANNVYKHSAEFQNSGKIFVPKTIINAFLTWMGDAENWK